MAKPMTRDTSWNPEQYRCFADQRAEPFLDLLAMIKPAPTPVVVDLGCGPGELTARAASHLGASKTVGIDNSPEMLDAANAFVTDSVTFTDEDISTWTSDGDVDVVLSSASLHWIPNHRAVIERWAGALRPSGQLAIQVPDNSKSVVLQVAAEVADREPFRSAFGPAGPPPDPVAVNVMEPEDYATVLYSLGFTSQKVVLRVYPHVLESTADAIEWVKGTSLRRFANRLPEGVYDEFLTEYRTALYEVLGDQRPFFFPFRRILMWAQY